MKSKSKKARKQPITAQPRSGTSNSHRHTQQTISAYHVLLKRRSALRSQLNRSNSGDETSRDAEKHLAEVEKQLEEQGGIQEYQRASVNGQSSQRGGDSAKVLVEWLKKRGLDDPTCPARQGIDGINSKLRCLEIGALKPDNLASCSSWIENTPIDLHSLHADILEQDFFERPPPQTNSDRFDIISCSLVLNFVDEPQRRGHMLRLIHSHLLPRESSLLFLVLPLPCVRNSRYLDLDSLRSILRCVGFEQMEERWKEGGKVGYWLHGRVEPQPGEAVKNWSRKKIIEDGAKKNNFAVIL